MLSAKYLRGAAAVIAGLWGLALFFPSIGTCRDGAISWFSTETTVFFGWMAAFGGLLGWYANITMLYGLYALVLGRRPSGIAGTIGLLLALTSFRNVELAHNEAWTEPLCAWGSGFWMWFSAQALLAAVAVHQAIWARRQACAVHSTGSDQPQS